MNIGDLQQELRKQLNAYLDRVGYLCEDKRFANFVVSRDVQEFVQKNDKLPVLIVVADNPGKNEHTHKEFLSARGSAGKIARDMLRGVFGAEFLACVLILNKSNYYTNRTADLSRLLSDDLIEAELKYQIRADQEENGKLVRRLATLLGIPVVRFGWESNSKTFEAFCTGHGQLNGCVTFRGMSVEQSQIVPHTSFRRCYGTIGGDSERAQKWNARLKTFLERHTDVPGLRTKSGAISEGTLRTLNLESLWLDYFATVILGAHQSSG